MQDIPVKKIAFVDLDDTLVQSLRKCPPGENIRTISLNPLLPSEKQAFTTAKQRTLISLLNAGFEVIPVTARNTASYMTLDLPFQSVAILNHGGTMMGPDRTLDREWHEHVCAMLDAADVEYQLRELYLRIHAVCDDLFPSVRVRLIEDHGLGLYVVAKDTAGHAENLQILRESVAQSLLCDFPGFYVHLNDNNLAFIPSQISKQAAVEHRLAQIRQSWDGPLLTLGMGDSLTDLPFMELCDYLVMPKRTQLHRQLQEVNHAL